MSGNKGRKTHTEWLYSVGIAVGLALQPALVDDLFGNHPLTPEAWDALVAKLPKRMTVDEKIGQLRSVSVGPDNPKEVIHEMIKDGQIGAIFNTVTRQDIYTIQDQMMELSHLKVSFFFAYNALHGQCMASPIDLGLTSPFNFDAMKMVGYVSTYEAADDGLNMAWVPIVDVSHDPHWGCISGGFGEDMHLVSVAGKIMAEAMQGKNPVDCCSVMTSAKHFVVHGAVKGGKECSTVDMSPQRLSNDYMPPYKAGLGAGNSAVMVALNSLGGTLATSDSWLLKDALRDQRGFKDITVPDYGTIKELIKHDATTDPEDAVRVTLRPGINISTSDEYYSRYLPGLIKLGKMTIVELDGAARHALNVKYGMRLLSDPYNHLGLRESDPAGTNAESRLHRKEACEATRESLVLLKSRFEMLPLRRSTTITVVGPLVDSKCDVMGSWPVAGIADQPMTVLTEIKNAVGENDKVLYVKGTNVTNDKGTTDFLNQYEEAVKVDPHSLQEMIDEAVQTARQPDMVVAVVDEARGMAHEAFSRADITIPRSQRDLIAALKVTGKPLVLVPMGGRPLTLVKEDQQADAIPEAQLAGTEGGSATADALFSDYNPSSKLLMFFPRSVGQIPVCYNHLNTSRPYSADKPNKYTSRYFDEANGALCPFNYGLSCTTFTVPDVKLSALIMECDDKVTASAQVTNTGKRGGAAAVQMYLQDVTASISRSAKQLKGFEKITLKPGETQIVSLLINTEALKFWSQQMRCNAEPGKSDVFTDADPTRARRGEFELL